MCRIYNHFSKLMKKKKRDTAPIVNILSGQKTWMVTSYTKTYPNSQVGFEIF